jgi:hypothetical protein
MGRYSLQGTQRCAGDCDLVMPARQMENQRPGGKSVGAVRGRPSLPCNACDLPEPWAEEGRAGLLSMLRRLCVKTSQRQLSALFNFSQFTSLLFCNTNHSRNTVKAM